VHLFPSHIDLDAPVGPGLAPQAIVVPAGCGPEVEALDAEVVMTLPGPQLVQGVVVLGPREHGATWDVATQHQLRQLALEAGRALTQLQRLQGGPPASDSRIKPPAQFIARLEEELARAERFKRELTVLWISV